MNMQQLAEYRIRCEITMSALAKALGMPRQQLNNTEKGNGRNQYASCEFKEKYINAINKIMMERMEKEAH
ncbi:helix-turn-helix domain-containing protein [Cellulosilyticum lentocellum]|uniref:Helix-turn-helix domain protein n=1 Tax=Cellulosilyticum lentocellum (strain ATCC 49066 / DSM 5427 / NCIMB 11756 / RHM5) TaxID=642492 RepID=F2JGF7_CELLD|nr:helix-turn-helix transcriptional regulator [Cellulosilyticum lentocellum]ADZ82912.1 helix-turn-helix domain protein [Cellulosilyticum lentocellum DSM 5427]